MDNKENSPSVIARNDDACISSSFFTVETTPSSLKMNPSSLPTSSLQRKQQQQQQEETQTEEGGGVNNNDDDGRTKSNYGPHDVTNSSIVLYEDFSLSEEDSSNNKVASSLTLQEHHHYTIGNKGKIQQQPITTPHHHQTDPPGLNSSIRFLSTTATTTTTAATTSSSSPLLLVDDHPSSMLSLFIDTDPPGKKTKMNSANPSLSLEISDDDEEEDLLSLLEQRKEETSNTNHHRTTTKKLLALLSNDPLSSSTISSSSSTTTTTVDNENEDDEMDHNNNLVLDTSTFSSILEISTLLSEEGEETIEFDYANDDGSCSDSGSSCIADYRDIDHDDASSSILLQQSSTTILSPCQKKKLCNKLDQVRRSLAKQDMDDEDLYWMILTTPTMKLIVDFVPTTKLELIRCFHILEEKYHDILNKYGNRLLNEIQRFLDQENLTDIIVRHNKMKKSRPSTLYLLSLYQQKKFIDTLKNLTSLWAKEERDRGNQIIDWDILSPSTIKSIADNLPTTEEELDAVLLSNNLQHCGGENNSMHNLLAGHGYKMKLIQKINEFLKYEKMKEQDIVTKQSIQRRNHRTTRQSTAPAVTTPTTSSKDVVTSNSSMPRSLSRSHSQPLLLQPKKNKILGLFGGSSSLLRRIFSTTIAPNNTTRQRTAAADSTRFRRQKMMMNFQRGNLSYRTV